MKNIIMRFEYCCFVPIELVKVFSDNRSSFESKGSWIICRNTFVKLSF